MLHSETRHKLLDLREVLNSCYIYTSRCGYNWLTGKVQKMNEETEDEETLGT